MSGENVDKSSEAMNAILLTGAGVYMASDLIANGARYMLKIRAAALSLGRERAIAAYAFGLQTAARCVAFEEATAPSVQN